MGPRAAEGTRGTRNAHDRGAAPDARQCKRGGVPRIARILWGGGGGGGGAAGPDPEEPRAGPPAPLCPWSRLRPVRGIWPPFPTPRPLPPLPSALPAPQSSGSSSAAAPPPSVEPIPREEQAAIVKELEDAARDAVTLSRGLLTFLGGALFVLHAFFGLRALAVAVDPEGGHFVMRHHAVLASVVPASVAALVEAASTLAAALGVAAARLGLDGAAAIGKAAAPGAARRQARAATLAGAAVALSGAVCFFWVWAILVARADAEQDIVRSPRRRTKRPVRRRGERQEGERGRSPSERRGEGGGRDGGRPSYASLELRLPGATPSLPPF